MHKDREHFIARIKVQAAHETRWLKRVPLLIGLIATPVAFYGYFMSYWTVMVMALFILTIGFTAQAVLWFGLWDLEKRY
ncbi:hypothetical protein ACFQDN_25200 [Pseudomonas asuensis]|jgi:hypothetical protein|uniref:Uncharacterized protein n=1 Tax=Pseudomonas asuensis TaxID=1825787 RepID=A0ABQ2GYD0_9PSED|nr:hypothetical protein [Pseudomonas asuensis]GGM20009.1 hypothetical protein GCM10009425_33530 [Pseudomonas asuensis]